MRAIKLSVTSLALALAALPLVARAETRIAYVDVNRVINEVEEGKAATAALKKEMDEKQAVFEAKQNEFEKAKADFDKQFSLLTEQAKKDKGAELEKQFNELQKYAMDQQRELTQRQAAVADPIIDRVKVLVKESAEAEGISMVIDRNAGIVWAQAQLDLTNDIIRKYNTKFPKKAGGAKPAGGKPAGDKPAGDKPAAKPK